MLHGRIVFSPHAHARIGAIDTSAALQQAGVVAVLTAADLRDVQKAAPSSRGRELLAHGVARYVGQPVAVVLAESEGSC